MPRLRLTIGAHERMEPAVVEATPIGLLDTEGGRAHWRDRDPRQRIGAARLAVPVGSFCVGHAVDRGHRAQARHGWELWHAARPEQA